MLGKDGRLYDSDFDFDGDGELDGYESAVMDDVIFGDGADSEENYEMEDELEEAGLDSLELECMDEEERREAIEDAGFDPDDYEPIVPPEPVRTMDAMASGERVVLSGASLTDITLKWTPTEAHGNTVYRYEVLIDTIGGDFTKPVETVFSDNNGLEPQLTLTHYQANTIGKLAKFRCNTNGTLRWKVRAYCGLGISLFL